MGKLKAHPNIALQRPFRQPVFLTPIISLALSLSLLRSMYIIYIYTYVTHTHIYIYTHIIIIRYIPTSGNQ